MKATDLDHSLPALFSELVYGAPDTGAYILNRGDAGLLASLDRLSADAASTSHASGASIAAHVRHVAYGLSLMNRWADGENPFADADWSAAWQQHVVSGDEWHALQQELHRQCDAWHATLGTRRDITGMELNGVIGSIIHLAYHLGAIRQIQAVTRGPAESE